MNDIVNQTIDRMLNDHNWDFYRDNYIAGKYSHQDLININNQLYTKIPEQVYFHPAWVRWFFQNFQETIRVMELGCYRGELAQQMMLIHSQIVRWTGFDICKLALMDEVVQQDQFHPIFLEQPVWTHPFELHDIFVSTHTLEHMTWDEVVKVFDRIQESEIYGVHLELPVREEGKVWRGGGSTHVLIKGRQHIRDWFIRNGWNVLREWQRGMDWAISLRR